MNEMFKKKTYSIKGVTYIVSILLEELWSCNYQINHFRFDFISFNLWIPLIIWEHIK